MKNIDGLTALVEGFKDGGVDVVTNFPGYYSHKVFSQLGGSVTSVNEKIAYEIAWGASLSGKRALTTFKNVGLSDAADPFLNSHLVGTNGGMVVLVFDDVDVEGSQSRQDSRNYFDFFGGLWLEPYSVESAYELAYKSFTWSEKFSLPVVIRVTNQLIYAQGDFVKLKKVKSHKVFVKNNQQFVIHPINSKYQRKVLAQKNKRIGKFVESLYTKPSFSTKNIVVGCNIREEKKFNLENIFRVFTYPLPSKTLKPLLNKTITVYEQGTPFAIEKINSLKSKNVDGFNGIIPDNSKGYITSKNYEKLFKALSKLKNRIVIGDLGEYTKDTLDSINGCLCFGSSISVGLGFSLASSENIFSIIGDAAYLHSGKNVIPELLKRNISANIIVISNGGSQGTGGQEIPGDLYYQPNDVEIYRKKYENTNCAEFEAVLKTMCNSNKVSILYIEMEIQK